MNDSRRQTAEILWPGEVVNVTEVHAQTNCSVWPRGISDIPRIKEYKMQDEMLTRSSGYYRDWTWGPKLGEPTCPSFSIAGPFMEWIVPGLAALRFDGKLEWNRDKMKVANHAEANEFIKPNFRKGWSFT